MINVVKDAFAEYRKAIADLRKGAAELDPRRYGTDLIKEKRATLAESIIQRVQAQVSRAEEQVQKVREGVKTNPGNDFAKRLYYSMEATRNLNPDDPQGMIETIRGMDADVTAVEEYRKIAVPLFERNGLQRSVIDRELNAKLPQEVQESLRALAKAEMYYVAVSAEASYLISGVADWQSDDRWDRLEMAENSLSREGALEQIEHDANHEASLAVAQAA